MADSTILGTTTVTERWRISLIKAVRETLDEDVAEGDRIVFRKEDGRVVIEPA